MKTNAYLDKMYTIIGTRDQKKQYRRSLLSHILPGPGLFYQKQLWKDIGGFDEFYSHTEEWKFEINVTKVTPLFLLDKKIVKWRKSPQSLSHNRQSITYAQNSQFYWNELRELINKEYGWGIRLDADLGQKFFETGNYLYMILRLLLPFYYVRKFLT